MRLITWVLLAKHPSQHRQHAAYDLAPGSTAVMRVENPLDQPAERWQHELPYAASLSRPSTPLISDHP